MMLTQGDIQFRVEAALGTESVGDLWDSAIWDESIWSGIAPAWQDITEYVQAISSKYGIDYFGDTFRAGKAIIQCDNSEGVFNPETPSPLPGALIMRPGRYIRVIATQSRWIERVLFFGIVDTMDEIVATGGDDSTMRLLCTDFLSWLQRQNPPALETPIPEGQDTDERITRILDDAGWFTDLRIIEPGRHQMLESTLSDTRLQEARIAATAEGGAFYQEGEHMVFRNFDWPTTDQPIAAYPGRGLDGDPQIIGVDADWTLANVRNDISLSRRGGSLVRYVDTASQEYYNGEYSFTFRDYECISDLQVTDIASKMLAMRAWDYQRLTSVTMQAMNDRVAATTILALDVGDLVRVTVPLTLRGWSYTTECYIAGCEWQITHDDWFATFRIDDASRIPPTDAGAFDNGWSLGFYA